MKRNDSNYIMLIMFMLLGLVLSVQFRSVMNSNKDKPSIAYKIESLKEQLNAEKVVGSKLREEIDVNIKKQEEYIKTVMENRNDDTLKKEWEEAKLAAGLTDVTGDGIVIKLNDAVVKIEGAVKLNIVHDTDLVEVVNELKKAGAKAISINNERIISTSEIICAGPTIRINRTRYSVPFEIKAIGDPKRMHEYLINSEIARDFKEYGVRFEVGEAKGIVVPKYSGKLSNIIKGLEVVE
ncbi:MAG: DUF881 domain-containing protein [Bacillota bacterium]